MFKYIADLFQRARSFQYLRFDEFLLQRSEENVIIRGTVLSHLERERTESGLAKLFERKKKPWILFFDESTI